MTTGTGIKAAILAAATWISSSATATAAPIASLEYVETSLGSGQFRYDYTLRNLGDPVLEAGFDIYNFSLSFSPEVTSSSSAVPSGWGVFSGDGFVEAFSDVPGPSPIGVDVAPGQSLGLFAFIFNAQIGSVPFEALFTNPGDLDNPRVVPGLTVLASVPDPGTPVPEPGSLVLLSLGLGILARSHRNRSRRRTAISERPLTQRDPD
jgi:hypothetical protein